MTKDAPSWSRFSQATPPTPEPLPARIRQDLPAAHGIQKLAKQGQLQMSLFREEGSGRDRSATEKQLEKITQRARRPLRGKQSIGLCAGKILNRYKMGKCLAWSEPFAGPPSCSTMTISRKHKPL